MNTLLSALTSRLGGGLAWLLCLALLVWGGWGHLALDRMQTRLQARVAELEQALEVSELEARGAKAALAQREVLAGALELQVETCHAAVAEYRVRGEQVRTVVRRVTVTPEGLVDLGGSREIVELINGFFE